MLQDYVRVTHYVYIPYYIRIGYSTYCQSNQGVFDGHKVDGLLLLLLLLLTGQVSQVTS